MAFKLASLFVEIGARSGLFTSALAGVKGSLGQVATAGTSTLGNLAKIAIPVAGLTAVGVGIAKCVQRASDLNETLSKVDTVFGPASKGVRDQAEQMAKDFGLPKGALLDASAAIGLVAKGAGFSQDAAGGMANSMSKLAADCASFYNVPLDEALGKIRAGLTGESEPLKAFGVLMNEDAVKAEALRQGTVKAGEALTEQAKVAARAAIIQRGLTDASGDLEKTQGSTSNQLRKFTGTLGNLATDFGTLLLPAVNAGITVLNQFAGVTAAALEGAKPWIESFVTSFAEGFKTLGIMVANWGDVWEITKLTIYEKIMNMGEYLWTIPENLALIGTWIGTNWRELVADGVNAVGAIFQNLGANVASLASAIFEFLTDPTKGFDFEWKPLLDGFEATAAALPEMVKPHLTNMQAEIAEAGERIARNAQKAADDQAAKAEKAGGPKPPPGPLAPADSKKFKAETLSLADFSSKIRAGTGSKDANIPAQQLTEAQKQTKHLEKLAKAGTKPVKVALG